MEATEKTPWSHELGRAVRQRRKLLRLTQEKLALYAGCGAIFIRHLETGKPTVRLDKVMDVLNILGMELVVRPRIPPGLRDPPEGSTEMETILERGRQGHPIWPDRERNLIEG